MDDVERIDWERGRPARHIDVIEMLAICAKNAGGTPALPVSELIVRIERD